ncbi:hypothetical protein F5Y15DRAFT_371542 [Xylariaceae sp. FL0016]|nr:hypothetical protein F5Y15DRAFT_371542 [Xylariaceae sp. FL0016]
MSAQGDPRVATKETRRHFNRPEMTADQERAPISAILPYRTRKITVEQLDQADFDGPQAKPHQPTHPNPTGLSRATDFDDTAFPNLSPTPTQLHGSVIGLALGPGAVDMGKPKQCPGIPCVFTDRTNDIREPPATDPDQEKQDVRGDGDGDEDLAPQVPTGHTHDDQPAVSWAPDDDLSTLVTSDVSTFGSGHGKDAVSIFRFTGIGSEEFRESVSARYRKWQEVVEMQRVIDGKQGRVNKLKQRLQSDSIMHWGQPATFKTERSAAPSDPRDAGTSPRALHLSGGDQVHTVSPRKPEREDRSHGDYYAPFLNAVQLGNAYAASAYAAVGTPTHESEPIPGPRLSPSPRSSDPSTLDLNDAGDDIQGPRESGCSISDFSGIYW